MGDGRYGALKQLTPITGADFGKIARDQELVEFRKRAEQREIDNAKKAEEDKKIAEQRAIDMAMLADLEKYRPIISGNKSYDEANMQGIAGAMDRRLEIYERFQKEPFMPNAEKNKLRLEYSQLGWQAQDQNEIAQMLKNYYGNIAEGLASKKYSMYGNKDLYENIDDITEGMNITYGHNAQGKAMVVWKNKDGSLKGLTREDLLRVGALPLPMESFDRIAFAGSIKNVIATLNKKRELGNYTTQETIDLKNESLKQIEEIVAGEVGTAISPNEKRAKMIWVEAMNRKESEYNWQKTHDWVESIAHSQYDEKDFITKEYSALNSGNNTPNTPQKIIDQVRAIREPNGQVTQFPHPSTGSGTANFSYGFIPPAPVKAIIGGQEILIEEYYIDSITHSITYKGFKKVPQPFGQPDLTVPVTNDPIDPVNANKFAVALEAVDAFDLVNKSFLSMNNFNPAIF